MKAPLENESPKDLTESDFLAQRAHEIKEAFIQTAIDFKEKLKNDTSLKNLVREKPLASTGIAVLAGFVAGVELHFLKKQVSQGIAHSELREKLGQAGLASLAANTGKDLFKKYVTPKITQYLRSL